MTHQTSTIWLKNFLVPGDVPGSEHFDIIKSVVTENDLKDGGVLVQALCFSVDPYIRWTLESMGRPKEEGRRIMSGYISGKIIDSKNPKFVKGDYVGGYLSFSTVQIVSEIGSIWKLPDMINESNISFGVGVLGMPGSTAYAGIAGVLRPNPKKENESIFISAASGAVGSIAGQIAKHVYNLKTIGSCGGPEKCELIKNDFGYDYAIDYKAIAGENREEKAKTLESKLKEICGSNGLNMYFENVGSFHFDAAFSSLGPGGRIAVCGTISDYNKSEKTNYNVNIKNMIYPCLRIEGFLCRPYLHSEEGNFWEDIVQWISEGKISKIEETFFDGIDQWPVAFKALFVNTQNNKGKLVVRV